ncbi:TolC family protein [Vibrio cincinnatiensis]|uniref:TolC family protein n=1 Tax=Vibrio cincinnatiensis TaxID=675 RepID=UPI0012AC8219|nr:TolC family protein [Vibrio cincinnatiensis]
MMSSHWLRLSAVSLLIAGLIGCATHSQQTYQARVSESLEQLTAWSVIDTEPAIDMVSITELIDIPELKQWIDRALEHNPSLQQTALALKIAYAQKQQIASDQLPSAELTLSGEKEEHSHSQYNTELSVSWELDIWQKIADGKAAASANLRSRAADYQAAKNTLAASIMRQWLMINLYQQQVHIETQRLELLQRNEKVVTERYRQGLGGLEDRDSALTNMESTRATLAEYQETLASARRDLTTLLGQLGSQDPLIIPAQFPTVLLSLAHLPEQDLARRPDLIAAYANIEAQQYTTQVAYKAMLPSLSFSAALSDSDHHLSDSLLTSPLWSILGQLTAPLFQGGKLKAEAEMEALTTEQVFWAYQETLLTAVNEVESALGQEQALERQQQHLRLALDSAQRSSANYLDKYRKGLVDILELLTIQQQTYDIEIKLAQVTYNRLSNRIDLGLALGLGVKNEDQ